MICSRCDRIGLTDADFHLHKVGKNTGKKIYSWCKLCHRDRQKTYYKANPEKMTKYREDNKVKIAAGNRRRRQDIKRQVLEHYAGSTPSCQCPGGCSEQHLAFLAIDHIDGGGTKHRGEVGAQNYYRWIVNNGFPENLRVLCHNCNMGRQVNGGRCPHEEV